jgi:flagellar biosynthesis/type III secretory pathway M-ring protein FliF/YscJ
VISWLNGGNGWGTREQAIPGEWALLLLIIVLGAVLGLVVLWFTLLRHERTVRRRDRRKGEVAFLDVGPAAVEEPEPGLSEAPEDEAEPREEPQPEPAAGANGQRKLTDEILSRVEAELAERDAPRWKELAALVHHEFGVTVHPTSIQKAVKKRRLAQTAAQSA